MTYILFNIFSNPYSATHNPETFISGDSANNDTREIEEIELEEII